MRTFQVSIRPCQCRLQTAIEAIINFNENKTTIKAISQWQAVIVVIINFNENNKTTIKSDISNKSDIFHIWFTESTFAFRNPFLNAVLKFFNFSDIFILIRKHGLPHDRAKIS